MQHAVGFATTKYNIRLLFKLIIINTCYNLLRGLEIYLFLYKIRIFTNNNNLDDPYLELRIRTAFKSLLNTIIDSMK